MKYSLRSLMIGVTLICVGTGIAVPWQKHRQLCLERAQLHSSKVREDRVVAGSFHFPPGSPEHVAVVEQMLAERRKENEEYRRLESEYRQAIWQPWLRLSIKDDYAP